MMTASFCAGAGMELFMIYGRVGSETFYDTAKRKEIERRDERRRLNEEYRHKHLEPSPPKQHYRPQQDSN